jgi:putative NADH-flavin reductase
MCVNIIKIGCVMKKIIKGRGQGKTWDLVTISAEKQIPIVVATGKAATHISDVAKARGLLIPIPIPAWKFENNVRGRNITQVLVDDAEHVLGALLGCQIVALSMNEQIHYTKEDIAKLIGKSVDDFEIV